MGLHHKRKPQQDLIAIHVVLYLLYFNLYFNHKPKRSAVVCPITRSLFFHLVSSGEDVRLKTIKPWRAKLGPDSYAEKFRSSSSPAAAAVEISHSSRIPWVYFITYCCCTIPISCWIQNMSLEYGSSTLNTTWGRSSVVLFTGWFSAFGRKGLSEIRSFWLGASETEFESSGGDLDTASFVVFNKRRAKLQEGDAELEGRIRDVSATKNKKTANPAEYRYSRRASTYEVLPLDIWSFWRRSLRAQVKNWIQQPLLFSTKTSQDAGRGRRNRGQQRPISCIEVKNNKPGWILSSICSWEFEPKYLSRSMILFGCYNKSIYEYLRDSVVWSMSGVYRWFI